METLHYFGTDLSSYGHYFWKLEGNRMIYQPLDFTKLPFNPERLLPSDVRKGLVWYGAQDGYCICAIAGSCKDTRGGTKSVFWTTELFGSNEWKDRILAIPIARRMIEQMPFEVQW